ncbi:MAG: hypothetical protein P8H65_11450 [Rhodothermales bacterium]|nr:hypothetical protein [Rhodothermales bacterium]HAY37299.1 hypothetical protein [Bacteroidota bacterium]
MYQHFRTLGIVMIGIGILTALSYVVEPLRKLLEWFWYLPIQLQIGGVVASIGLVVLFISLLGERWAAREEDASLKDDPHKPNVS